MTTIQKTTIKPATKPATVGKPATKPAASRAAEKPATAQKTAFYAALYIAIMAGKFATKDKDGKILQLCRTYYQRADKYHAGQKTIFPRVRTAEERATMTKAKAQAIITRAAAGTLASGAADGQALYDLMKIGADASK